MEVFEKEELSRYSCGRAKTEVFNYDGVMPEFRAYDSKTLRRDADIFKYGEENSVFENTRLRVDEA